MLRALFACPCIPPRYGGSRLPIVADQLLESSGAACPLEWVDCPTLYPAPPSAQIPGWLCSNGEPREQAHLPAEQPSSGQDPWLPPAYAHPCRSRDSGCSPRQGSLRTFRLRLDACCRRVIVCEPAAISAQFFEGRAELADLVQAVDSSWFMSTQPTRVRDSRRGSVLSSPRLLVTRSFATAPSGYYELS